MCLTCGAVDDARRTTPRACVRGRTDVRRYVVACVACVAYVGILIHCESARTKRKQPAERLTRAPRANANAMPPLRRRFGGRSRTHRIASHLANRTQDIRDKLKPTSSNRGRGGASSSGRPGRGRPRARPRVTERRDEDEEVVRFLTVHKPSNPGRARDWDRIEIHLQIDGCIWFFFSCARAPRVPL